VTGALAIALARGVEVIEDGPTTVLANGARGISVPGLGAVIRALAGDGAAELALGRLVEPDDLPLLHYHLARCRRARLLRYAVLDGGETVLEIEPMTADEPAPASLPEGARVQLSRFAYCRRAGDALVLESPLAAVRVRLPGPQGAAVIGALARPCPVGALPGVGAAAAQTALELLVGVGCAVTVGPDGRSAEEAGVLRQREFHDVLFHARSRYGRHDYPMGGTFRFAGEIPPPPARRRPHEGEPVALHVPDLEACERADPPFTHVLEARRSARTAPQPPTARDLGEFLYRVARVRAFHGLEDGRPYESTSRPYPSGGGMYDLEVYVTVDRCADLPGGLYHYDAFEHRLCRLSGATAATAALLAEAQRACGEPPPVLLTLASRFERLSWKYNGIAYAATLKNVGVLYQTMYLVATAMGLAGCALGAGDTVTFARATGLSEIEESSVGEFVLAGRLT
jgi:SagB-type dehydrogenase family enzyme